MTVNDVRDCQLKQLSALHHIDELCKINNLCYFLHTGTLLGAVRHKGYIPWDMDTDILMPEADCEKLLQLIENEKNRKYTVVREDIGCASANRIVLEGVECYCPGTVYLDKHVHIDISCYANAKRYLSCFRVALTGISKLLITIIAYRHNKISLSKEKKGLKIKQLFIKIGNLFLFWASDKQIRTIIKKLSVSPNNTGYVTVFNSYYGFPKETYPSSFFAESKKIQFEDMLAPIPIGSKSILENLYGTWEKLPPEEKRYPEKLNEYVFRCIN